MSVHPDRKKAGRPIEEYYKWQFINAIVLSGLYPKDYVGVEVHFPKGIRVQRPYSTTLHGWITTTRTGPTTRHPT
jgi:hypothetical protein